MTQEERIRLAVAKYNNKKSIVDSFYTDKKKHAPANEAGEVDAEYLLTLNMWHALEIGRLRIELMKTIRRKEA